MQALKYASRYVSTASLFLGTNVGEALRFTWGQLSATQPSVIKEKICVEDFL